MSATLDPDADRRQAELEQAAHRAGVAPAVAEHLAWTAETRALPGPVHLDGRDLVREFLEEVVDGAGNYGPWELQRLAGETGSAAAARAADITEALEHALRCYDCLLRAAARELYRPA